MWCGELRFIGVICVKVSTFLDKMGLFFINARAMLEIKLSEFRDNLELVQSFLSCPQWKTLS